MNNPTHSGLQKAARCFFDHGYSESNLQIRNLKCYKLEIRNEELGIKIHPRSGYRNYSLFIIHYSSFTEAAEDLRSMILLPRAAREGCPYGQGTTADKKSRDTRPRVSAEAAEGLRCRIVLPRAVEDASPYSAGSHCPGGGKPPPYGHPTDRANL
ncbi:MAG: hypothetical protein IJN53_07370 [Oscillospiraceae bacterium]|nr:hypothetical protein [Oscillospiraceae bacterium]